MLETIGYAGSVLVAISLMMSNLKHLRWINMVGAAIFSIYGYLIQAWPVVALNGWIAMVNIFYLVRMYQSREKFDLVDVVAGMKDPVVKLFINHYRKDIGEFYPDVNLGELDDCQVWLTYRDLRPSGIFIFRNKGYMCHTTDIVIDYAAPEYRDFKNAKIILEQQVNRLTDGGTHLLTAHCRVKSHQDYLKVMGFISVKDNSNEFQRVISVKTP